MYATSRFAASIDRQGKEDAMKRVTLLVVLALGIGAALAATGRGKKFPYLPTSWNRQVRMTDAELACIRSTFHAREPVVLRKERLAAVEILPDARATHLRLTVRLKRLDDGQDALNSRDLEHASSAALAYWSRSLLRRSLPDESACPVTIDLLLGSKVLFRQIRDARGRKNFMNPPI